MATRTVKTKLEIDGEKQYKESVKEINQSLNVLNSEMKKTTAQFQDNAKSVEALKAKGDVLNRTLLEQKEKVETLKKALQESAEKYGEADKRTKSWQTQLNNAEAAVANTEHAIKENNAALDQSSKKFQINGEQMKAIATKAAAVVAAITAVAAAYKKLIDMTTEAANNADNILTLAQITGMDTDTIQQMQYAAELIDVSFDTIKGSLTKLKNNMQDSANGSEKLQKAFKQLGVSVTDANGNLRDSQTVFYECIDALGDIENVTERDALAMDIFGKSAEELNPLIIQGSDAMRQYAKEAEDVGYVLSNDDLNALGAVDDAYQRLQATQEAVRNHMAAELAPAVEELYTAWTAFIQQAGQAIIDSGILTNLASILHTISSLINPVDSLGNDGVPRLTQSFRGLADVLNGLSRLLAAVADTVNLLKSLTTLDFRGVAQSLGFDKMNPNNYQRTLLEQSGNWEQYQSYYGLNGYSGGFSPNGERYNASGTQNFVGGATWVGENGAERVWLPQGTRIDNAQESRMTSGSVTYNITIDAKSVREFNDIVRIAQNARVTSRMG